MPNERLNPLLRVIWDRRETYLPSCRTTERKSAVAECFRCEQAAFHPDAAATLNHRRVELPSERKLPRSKSNVSTGPQLPVLISGRISVPDRPVGRGIDVKVSTKKQMTKSAVSRSWSRVGCNATVEWRWRSSERGFKIDYIRWRCRFQSLFLLPVTEMGDTEARDAEDGDKKTSTEWREEVTAVR